MNKVFKKLIAYQRLLLNSMPSIYVNFQNNSQSLRYFVVVYVIAFMAIFIFTGNRMYENDIFSITFPVISVWMINKILHSERRLFELVPVSRKYIALNVFLLSIVIIFIGYICNAVIAGLVFGISYIMDPHGFKLPPEIAIHQMIDTTKGNILMLFVLLLILFAGIAITFIKNKKLRISSFIVLATIYLGVWRVSDSPYTFLVTAGSLVIGMYIFAEYNK